MDVTRRPALPSDTEFARRVHHLAYREVVERQFGPWDEAQQDEFFEGDWAGAAFEILSCDDTPCGYVCLEDREDDVLVRELVILPAFQGRGVGTSVLRAAMERAVARGVPLRLGTFHLNRAADLYRRLGFREVGRTPTHVEFEWRNA